MWRDHLTKPRPHTTTDNEELQQKRQFLLEKRHTTKRGKRKRGTSPGIKPNMPVVTGVGMSKGRLSRGLSNSLSNGVGIHGLVPTIQKVQEQINRDLERQRVDLSSIKGPPTYRDIPKPDFKPVVLKKERTITNKENQPANHRVGRESDQRRKLPPVPKIAGVPRDHLIIREKPRLNQVVKPRTIQEVKPRPSSTQVEEMFEMANRLIAKSVTEAWPSLDYEKKLQDKLCKQMKTAQEKLKGMTDQQCLSGGSSTNLNQPFHNWSIEDLEHNDFNKSFCKTIKRTFAKDASFSEPTMGATRALFRKRGEPSSATSLVSEQSDSGCDTMDFLDTIMDKSTPNFAAQDLTVRGIRHDFLDEVDRLYNFEPAPDKKPFYERPNLQKVRRPAKSFYRQKDWFK